MIVSVAPCFYVGEFWESLEPHFRDFEERCRGDVTAEELARDVSEGRRQMWLAVTEKGDIKAVGLTEIIANTLWFDYCNGEDRELWQDQMVDEVKGFAEREGKNLKVFARTGWTPLLKKHGLRETHRIFEDV